MRSSTRGFSLTKSCLMVLVLVALLCNRSKAAPPSSSDPVRAFEGIQYEASFTGTFEFGGNVSDHPDKKTLSLDRRFVDLPDSTWNTAISKGCKHYRYFGMTRHAVQLDYDRDPESQWTDYSQLDGQGWSYTDQTDGYPNILTPYQDMLHSLSLTDTAGGSGPWKVVLWKHDQTKNNVPATGGKYRNLYNVQDGAIFGQMLYGPEYYKRLNNLAATPDLQTWSDVTFLEWAHQAGDNVKNIKYIGAFSIGNDLTQAVIHKALQSQGIEEPSTWPGNTFKPGTYAFDSLLGTPNGWGVGFFLWQHKQELGLKRVSEITVFKSAGSASRLAKRVDKYLDVAWVMKVEDVGTASTVSEPGAGNGGQSKRSADVAHSSPCKGGLCRRDDGPAPNAQIDPISDGDWNKLVTKGCNFLTLLGKDKGGADSLMGSSSQSSWQTVDNLAKYGWSCNDYSFMVDFKNTIPIQQTLNDMGISPVSSTEGGPWHLIYCVHDSESTVDGKTYPPTQGRNIVLHNADSGAVVAWGSASPAYMGQKQNPAVTGDSIIPLQRWSDLAYLGWLQIATDANAGKISSIFRVRITNQQTRQAAYRAVGKQPGDGNLPKWPGQTFKSDSDELKALLGTPNGVGVAWLLINHKDKLGGKTVYEATLWEDGARVPALNLIFKIK